jgi:hypothetical protein
MPRCAALACLIVALALSACGGGGSSTASQTTVSTEGGGFETGPLKVVGGGSSSYRIRRHHARVPGFGEACSYVSKGLVGRLGASSPRLAGEGCPAILAALTVPGPGGSDYESSEVEAESLRAKGARGFLLYRAATAPYFMRMVKERGAWKVDLLAPTPFY